MFTNIFIIILVATLIFIPVNAIIVVVSLKLMNEYYYIKNNKERILR